MKAEYQTSIRRASHGLFGLGLAEIAGGIASIWSNSTVNETINNNARQMTFELGVDWTNAGLIIAGIVTITASAVIDNYLSLPSQRNYIGNLEGELK